MCWDCVEGGGGYYSVGCVCVCVCVCVPRGGSREWSLLRGGGLVRGHNPANMTLYWRVLTVLGLLCVLGKLGAE